MLFLFLPTGIGAAYGTAKSGIGIVGVATFRPDLIMKCLIPVVMSGIIAVYALVISVLIAQDMGPPGQTGKHYSLFEYGNCLCPSPSHPPQHAATPNLGQNLGIL